MRIIEPWQFARPLKKKHHVRGLALFLVILLLLGYATAAYAKPLPSIKPQLTSLSPSPALSPKVPWPSYGQAALGAVGYGVLAENGNQTMVPTASVAKVLTALAVLKQKPLTVGDQGPSITITDEDVQSYNTYIGEDGSVVAVTVGEQISEYQALQALLLPSANNMAFTLTRWAFSSTDDFTTYANHLATALGLTQTHMADASGFSPDTKSTAHDLVLLGETALLNPVLASIVQQPTATIPVAGEIRNVNWLLGQAGINGIKTGNTDQAGGCFLFSSTRAISGQSVTIVGVIMSAPNLGTAMRDALPLLDSAMQNLHMTTLLEANQTIAVYNTAWGDSTKAVAKDSVKALVWAGSPAKIKANVNEIAAPLKSGSSVGSVAINIAGTNQVIPVVLSSDLSPPGPAWRLTHYF